MIEPDPHSAEDTANLDSASEEDPSGRTGNRPLRVGILTPVSGLEPWDAPDLVSLLAVEQIYETPLRFPDENEDEPEPVLFAGPLRREPAPQGDRYRARIAEGVRFSDGTALTTEHVAASLGRVELIRDQARIETRGDEILFRLDRPNPRFPVHLTISHCGVALRSGPDVIGTGPFRRVPGSPLDELVLEPNPYHHREVGPDGIEFVVYPPDDDGRPTGLIRAMDSGEVDFTNMISRADAAEVTGCKKRFQPSISTGMLFLNTEKRELAGVGVRRAIAHAVDRRALTGISYDNVIAYTAATPLPPRFGVTTERLPHDAGRARALVAEGGERPERPLRLLQVWAPRPYLPHPGRVAKALREQLAQVGLAVEIEVPANADEFFGRQKSGDYDMILGGWIADLADPAEFLTAILHSSRIPRHGVRGVAQGNLARIRDERLDETLEAYQVEDTEEARDRVLDHAAELAPIVPIMYGATAFLHRWNLRNLEASPYGVPNFGHVRLE